MLFLCSDKAGTGLLYKYIHIKIKYIKIQVARTKIINKSTKIFENALILFLFLQCYKFR